mgnify:CR=1 FL=1
MLIDVLKLDPAKTYVGLEVGTSRTARILQRLQHQKYKQYNREDIASHVLALIYRGNGWNVWENHLEWKGIKEYTLEDYERINANKSLKTVIVNEYPLNLDAMDYFRNNNPGYSVLDLGKITGKRLMGLKLPNTPGMVCSEAVANCGFEICNKLGIKSEYITPVDFQHYFDN